MNKIVLGRNLKVGRIYQYLINGSQVKHKFCGWDLYGRIEFVTISTGSHRFCNFDPDDKWIDCTPFKFGK